MQLSGSMNHYVWMINELKGNQAKPIMLKSGKRYRLIFTNISMMHHPMHIHGHWFILRNGHGAYDPLLHTIDIPPGATVVADIDANASGQWFFHCHQLYHMEAGMSRVFQYDSLSTIEKGENKNFN
jgi:FtsP/CotA-like multicopper oxidase with cupredoxin domain